MTRLSGVVLALIVLCASSLRAQVEERSAGQAAGLRESVFGLGFSAGFASGIGLSFKHHLPGKLSWVANGGVIKSKDKLSYALGGELQFDLHRSPASRFFAVAAGGYYYSGNNDQNEMEAPGRLGIGIGGELPLASGLGLTAQLLFTYMSDGTILPLPQGSIHYYFR
jgi:hypothetical protein